ncbi:F420-dependent glucose-6-phosphate dehydrogenase [Streptomyces antimycoticus]
MTAMTAATLAPLSGGRFRLGLGVSGPQVSEGWYGVKFDKPLARTREYVEIVRKAMTRERLSYEGQHWTLPLPGGPGKPIKLTVHPEREHIPLYIAAIGPKNLEQTGEIADGALLIFPSAEHLEETALTYLRAGREKAGKNLEGFDVSPTLPLASATTSRGSPTCSARTPPCTSAAWAAGSRTSTTSSRAHGVREGGRRDPGQVPGRGQGRGRRRRTAPADRPDHAARLRRAHRRADAGYAAAGVTTLTLAPAGLHPGASGSPPCAPVRTPWSAPDSRRASEAQGSTTAVVGARGSSPPRPSPGTTRRTPRGYAGPRGPAPAFVLPSVPHRLPTAPRRI